MYESGEYTELDKTFAGTYSKVSSTRRVEEASPYGGVAIPVTVVSHSPDIPEWPNSAIIVTRGNKTEIMSKYTFAQRDLVDAMVTETLANASRVYLCPYDGINKELKLDYQKAFGKGNNFSAEVYFVSEDYYHSINGVTIQLTHKPDDPDNYSVQIFSPDGNAFFDVVPDVSIAGMMRKNGLTIQYHEADLSETVSATAIFDTDPKQAYDTICVTYYLNTPLATGEVDKCVVFSGHGKTYAELITSATNVNTALNVPASYVACNMDDTNLSILHADPVPTFAYIKNTKGHSGAHTAYYLDIQNHVAILYFNDIIANVYPAEKREIQRQSYADGETVYGILLKFNDVIHVDGEVAVDTAWRKATVANCHVIIPFTPIYPRKPENDRFLDFMRQAGNSRVELLYYPFWSDDFEAPAGRVDCKEHYRKFQQLYLDNRGTWCNYSQLLMDEALMKESRQWVDNDPLTLASPHLVSLASGLGGKRSSQLIGAYTAGALVSSGGRSAKAFIYSGSPTLKLYTQEQIKNMYTQGVMAYHRQGTTKMLYLDNSAYKYETALQKSYPPEFERNYVIRTVHMLQARVDDMFSTYYGDDDHIPTDNADTVCQMLEHDIIGIINGLRSYGRLMPPQSEDVLVTELSHTGYHAKVGLRLLYSPEILYLDIGI